MDEYHYILQHSSPQDEALVWLERETHLRTRTPQMLCGPVEGRFLTSVSSMMRPKAVLEIGTFTGYSAICLAKGLADGGVVDTLELNDELEDLILEGFRRAGVEDRINLLLGDANEIIPGLDKVYDLVFIDANKRQYTDYYKLVIDKVRPGGFILADNVLWKGKLLHIEDYQDEQTLAVQTFNEYVAADRRVENTIVSVRDGVNVIRKL